MKQLERKVKGNWVIEIVAKKYIVGTVSYTLYVFDRTIRQFALIQEFKSLKDAKNYLNNMLKK